MLKTNIKNNKMYPRENTKQYTNKYHIEASK